MTMPSKPGIAVSPEKATKGRGQGGESLRPGPHGRGDRRENQHRRPSGTDSHRLGRSIGHDPSMQPLASPSNERHSYVTREATEAKPIRIMVVEDEALVAMDLRNTLQRLGYEVVGSTARGEEVVQLANGCHPDVILMDVRLAGAMDGIEAATRVREQLDIPVVFLTAYTDGANLERAKLAFPYGYVVKPFDSASLHAAVEIIHYRRLAEQEHSRAEQIRENAMQDEVRRLQELNEMRARFVSMASHELNTPLTPILLSLEVLGRSLEGKLGPREERSLKSVARNLKRLAALVHDLLDAARMQSGRLEIRPTESNIRAIAEGVVETFRARAEEKDIVLHVKADGAARGVADPNRITQVITNLVHNALKFTPAEGRVDVTVLTQDGVIEVKVKDTGRGLEQAQIRELFQPFSMVHDIVSTPDQGTGLGLYLSRGIAEAHGGRLECQSEGPGHGSTFTLTLPVAGPPVMRKKESSPPATTAEATAGTTARPVAGTIPPPHRTGAKRPPRPPRDQAGHGTDDSRPQTGGGRRNRLAERR